MKKHLSVWIALGFLAGAMACTKSSPSRPSNVETPAAVGSITDAKTGITLTTPQLIAPPAGAQFKFADQPVTVTWRNAVTTGSTALTYFVEVSSDGGFGTIVASKDGIAAGGGGQTSLTLDKLAGAKTYSWHVRASSGSFLGPFTGSRAFSIGPEVVLQKPVLGDPAPNATVPEQPTLNVYTVSRTGPAGPITYRIEISDSNTFGSLVYVATVNERTDLPYTPHMVANKLAADKFYWWRVQARDASNNITSPYSDPQSFKVTRGLDLHSAVIVLGPTNIADWPEVATISDAYWSGGLLCIFHDHLGVWPPTLYASDGTTIEGNQWVFANINGTWYGGAADWYRPGQACKGVDQYSIARDAFYLIPQSPIYSWVPSSGETFAVMSTTPARLWPSFRTYDERTNVQLVVWP